MAEPFRCAVRSRGLGEPCYGTASQVRRWILVEQPGTWGVDAVMESGLPSQVARPLRAAARAARARLLLIRRHGRAEEPAAGRRRCYVAVTTADVRRVEALAFDDPRELLAVDWSRLARFEPVGEVDAEPLYLVCTNGRHDTCCAIYGRPLATALSGTAFGDRVWEASHYGGDRFAGNLVCLPDGVYYGRVDPGEAVGLVEAHRAGVLALDRYRGRSFVPFLAQAAEQFVRVDRLLDRHDDVWPGAVEDRGGGRFRVRFATSDGDVSVVLERSEAMEPQQLTCRSAGQEHPPRYRLVSLD